MTDSDDSLESMASRARDQLNAILSAVDQSEGYAESAVELLSKLGRDRLDEIRAAFSPPHPPPPPAGIHADEWKHFRVIILVAIQRANLLIAKELMRKADALRKESP